MGGLKTETGKFHEILTVFFLLLHEHLQRKSTFFLYPPPPNFLLCVGGLKTETGKFLLHFENSKSSNRCRSVYGTDINIRHTGPYTPLQMKHCSS